MQISTDEQQRQTIRQQILIQRKQLNEQALQSSSEKLLHHCKPFLQQCKTVAGYQAMGGEIPLTPVFDYCQSQGMTTLLPIMQGKELTFAPFDRYTTFETRQFGILEPTVSPSSFIQPNDIDIVLVPLVAFDNTGNRIGMGGGFYDRSFALRKENAPPPVLIGVAHAFQQVDSVFAQTWDVQLDSVVTDEGVIGQ